MTQPLAIAGARCGIAGTRRSALALLLLAQVLLSLLLAGDARAGWPVYGHDLANSRDAGSEGPAAKGIMSLAPAWRFDSSTGDFTGTPVVAGGVLVAGNNGGWVY